MPQAHFYVLSFNQTDACHISRCLKSHQTEHRRCNICKLSGTILRTFSKPARFICNMNQRHWIGRVCSYNISLSIGHIVRIAVVGCQENLPVFVKNSLDYAVNAEVKGLNSFNSCLKNSCMANHVGIGKVKNYHIILI